MLNIKSSLYRDATILITGGTGSIGLELAKAVLHYEPKQVRLFSNDENGLFEARNLLGKNSKVVYSLGDVRDPSSIESVIVGCNIVFHAAALKHVDICERSPYEAIFTNILGTQNVIDCATKNEVSRFVYVSSDKAVNPLGTMGATKLLGEKLTISASKKSDKTVFSCVRFGNVLGSRGSVLRIFERQVRNTNLMTVTDPKMTRFIMLPSDAARLVLHATVMAKSGEIFLLKMNAVKIGDLAEASREFFAKLYGKEPSKIKINIIGANAGEKTDEELMTSEEALRAVETEEFYIIAPLLETPRSSLSPSLSKPCSYTSNSAPLLSKSKIITLLSTLYAPEST